MPEPDGAAAPGCPPLLEALPHAVVQVDGAGRLVHANREWWRLQLAVEGRPWSRAVSPDGRLDAALATGGAVDLTVRRTTGGAERFLRLRAAAGRGDRLVVVDDVTAAHRAALALAHEASVEPLTGLASRSHLLRRLEEAVRTSPRRGALLFVDLDRFKLVNDTLGHEVGDQVLRTVAARLRRTARELDCLARLGGDEFVVLAADVHDADGAAALADRVRHAVEQPIWVEGRPVRVGASVGAVLLEDCEDAGAALRVADTAMQGAKQARRGRVVPLVPAPRDPLRHTVSFYDDDALVVAEVADLVGPALLAGRPALVVATAAHRDAVAALLRSRGHDLPAAVREGRYVPLDAQELMDEFLVDGVPDEGLFELTVGTTVRRLLAQGCGLDVYGEMVSLLWQQGRVEAALSLEDLWNALQVALPFRPHCAYSVRDALAPPGAHGLHPVCVRHSHVL